MKLSLGSLCFATINIIIKITTTIIIMITIGKHQNSSGDCGRNPILGWAGS